MKKYCLLESRFLRVVAPGLSIVLMALIVALTPTSRPPKEGRVEVVGESHDRKERMGEIPIIVTPSVITPKKVALPTGHHAQPLAVKEVDAVPLDEKAFQVEPPPRPPLGPPAPLTNLRIIP